MELNLSGIDDLLNPAIPQDPKLTLPDLDLTGVDDILSASSSKISFQPENTDWSLSRLSSIQDFYLKKFGKTLPISNIGQGSIHKKWSYDHRASADIGLNPNSKEGKELISFLKKNNIPFLAFSNAQRGVSTGPHIHIGRPSSKTNQKISIGEQAQELNLEGIDEILQVSPENSHDPTLNAMSKSLDGVDLDLSGVENIQAPLDLTGALDPKKIDFEVATKKVPALLEWATRYNKPVIITQNPNELGPVINATLDNKNNKPTVKELTDAWLNAWNPEYKDLNDKFREETGGLNIAVVDSRKNYKFLKGGKIEISSRPTRGVQALFEAYKKGGLREFNATNMLINEQLIEANNQQAEIGNRIKEYEKKHPYLSAIESGVQGTAQSITQFATNIKYLDKAIATGSYYGWNSKEYLDLINKEIEEQETIAELGSTIYNPPSFTGKVIAGAVQGATSLPLYITASRISPAGLPLMVYTENLHRGNREAALSALPMAIMVGSGRGLAKFTDIDPAGSSAPFRRITNKDISILQDSIVKGESVSIAQLTPFERQLVHRGVNALSLQVPTSDQPFEEFAANLVVGLGFPVGRSPAKVDLPNYVPPSPKPKIPLQLSEARVNINDNTLSLDLDTANLNLLELKRSLEEKTYRREGDDIKTVLQKQQAIKNAIDVLEKAIPEPTKEFFKENEKVIRAALRTNWEAKFGKEQLIKRREESLKPDGIKFVDNEIPKINTGKETVREIFAGKAGDQNVFTSQEKAHEILNDFFRITTQGTLKSSFLPYGDVIARKIQDLSYLSAFYVEDFYRRGVVPTVELVLNKIKGSIGDYGKYISDDQAKEIFNRGLEFYSSNVADPFFSRLKLDAAEKLQNKLDAVQVENFLKNYDESNWIAGLDEFLQNKKNNNSKINKQELIDVIQKGQVRVIEETFGEGTKNKLVEVDYAGRDRMPLGRNYRQMLLMWDTDPEKFPFEKGHFGRANETAHYRTSDRTTTDGQNILFGEEFQSSWANLIRAHGTKEENKARYFELVKKYRDLGTNLPKKEMLELQQLSYMARDGNFGEEPMPFMKSRDWKELTTKRFLREAAISKDENGNYKYNGIGWITSKQQLRRNKRTQDISNFKWKKNNDGTYSFEVEYENTWWKPPTLENIPLEKFSEIVGKEYIDEYNIEKVSEGEFSTRQPVEIIADTRSTFGDYDNAFRDIFVKLGKRFGATYSQKSIMTGKSHFEETKHYNTANEAITDFRNGVEIFIAGEYGGEQKVVRENQIVDTLEVGDIVYSYEPIPEHPEQIHYIDITPSMRQSLEKEGLPLFGLGGLEPLKSSEIGVRNLFTTREAFNQHREFLVKALEETIPQVEFTKDERAKYEQAILDANKEDLDNMQLVLEAKKESLFGSGLSADQFVDEAKLLYNNVESFDEFSKTLLQRFGEKIKPFLQDLWMQVKNIAKAFNEDERGFINLQLKRMQTDAEKRYRSSHKKLLYYDNYTIHRGIMLAQSDPMAGLVYDVMRTGQRDKNAFEANVLADLRMANKFATKGTEQAIADNIFIGNESQKLFTNAELAAGDPATGRPALNPDQIEAYRNAYKAEHRNLDKRLQHVLFGYRERADRLNARLASFAPGTTAHTNILSGLLDIADAMKKVTDHYQHLKESGYISLKRRGQIAAFVQDPAFPLGDKRGEIYNQFNSVKEAGIWVAEQEKNLKANPANSNIYDLNIPQRLRQAAARLTPAQFEELIDSSGVNPRSKEVEELRDEVYSRFPSKGYELKRDYIRGYDRTWQFILESIANQTEIYANSFYSRVAGEHAIKALDATGLLTTNPDLHKVLQKYIDHEISSPEVTGVSKTFTAIRKGVYLFHLGFDINQLYLNAIAQPITQTYSYFARVSHNGKMLGPFEAEKYWIEGWSLAVKVAKESITGKSSAPKEFLDIRERLIKEGVITPEFNKSLLESETEKTVSAKLEPKSIAREAEHWAGVFMRAGEKTTRTHAAAEAYLVGKNKFKLTGEDLVNFIVRAIDATQTNPSRAESPLLIRGSQNQGEIRKLLYQFNAFNHMWIENLALNVKEDFRKRRISATSRHLIPLAIMGGISGLPLSGLMAGLYTAITNKDPKDEFHKYVNNFPLLERLALYGVTGNATLSKKAVPTVPFTESFKFGDTFGETLTETFSTSVIPAFSTAGQITRGFDDLLEDKKLRAAGSILPLKPLRNLATAARYEREGIKTRKGKTILPKEKVTSSQLFFQGLGIPPSPLTEYYEKRNREKRTKTIKKLRKKLL